LVQLGESLPKNYASALQSECRHDCSDDEVRPAVPVPKTPIAASSTA
jgi:hypothetical protein